MAGLIFKDFPIPLISDRAMGRVHLRHVMTTMMTLMMMMMVVIRMMRTILASYVYLLLLSVYVDFFYFCMF